jgi:hypothetical protein
MELVLVFLLLLHWVILATLVVYAFVRKTPVYDYIYLSILTIVFVGWIFNKNECMISLIEKLILNCEYKWGEIPHINPSLMFFTFSKDRLFTNIILAVLLGLLLIYNLAVVLQDYVESNIVLFAILISVFCVYIYYAMFLKLSILTFACNKHKKEHRTQTIYNLDSSELSLKEVKRNII